MPIAQIGTYKIRNFASNIHLARGYNRSSEHGELVSQFPSAQLVQAFIMFILQNTVKHTELTYCSKTIQISGRSGKCIALA